MASSFALRLPFNCRTVSLMRIASDPGGSSGRLANVGQFVHHLERTGPFGRVASEHAVDEDIELAGNVGAEVVQAARPTRGERGHHLRKGRLPGARELAGEDPEQEAPRP